MISVAYDSTTLTDAVISGVEGLRIAGRQLNQELTGVRASAKAFAPRGNREAAPISFSVTRIFSTVAAAEQFAHDHFGDLSSSGDLVFTLADASTRTYAAAVLDACDVQLQGLSVRVDYLFRAPLAT